MPKITPKTDPLTRWGLWTLKQGCPFAIRAERMARIWQDHDYRDFGALNSRVRKLLSSSPILVQREAQIEEAAHAITTAYKIHANLDDRLGPGPFELNRLKTLQSEPRLQIISSLQRAFDLLGESESERLAFHHTEWWLGCMLRNKTGENSHLMQVAYHLFMEHRTLLKSSAKSVGAMCFFVPGALLSHDTRVVERGLPFLGGYFNLYNNKYFF